MVWYMCLILGTWTLRVLYRTAIREWRNEPPRSGSGKQPCWKPKCSERVVVFGLKNLSMVVIYIPLGFEYLLLICSGKRVNKDRAMM